MKVLFSAALIASALVSGAQADSPHVIHGLYCKTEAQVEEAIAYIRRDVSPQVAVEMTNRQSAVCVFADKIWYMLVHPLVIGETQHRGLPLIKYEGTLVGVLVGHNPRPVEPPMRIFFVLPERLRGASKSGGA